MSEAETMALVVLHKKQQDMYRSLSATCCSYLAMDANTLKACGHASVEAALLYTTTAHKKALDKLIQDHVKKFPD